MNGMRKVFYYCLFLTALLSCTNAGNQPKIVDESFAPTQEDLYRQCAELKGIGDFVINKTTFQQAIRSNIYKNTYSILLRNNFYNGHWGVANRGEKYDLSVWIEKNGPKLKHLPCPSISIEIGQMMFDAFDLAFYDNKLAAIFFKTNNESLHEHYIEKYGTGRGSFYSYHLDNEPCKDRDKLQSTTTTKEERIWENEDVTLEYHSDYHFEMGPNIDSIRTYYDDSWYLLSSKTLYPKFLEELKSLQDKYQIQKSEKEKEALNQF